MLSKPEFITDPDFKLLKSKYKNEKRLRKVIKRIENDYPIQYAIGNVEFLNNIIDVDRRALIPRFETELLVSKLIDYIKINKLNKGNILDLCTGSGCIAISLKKVFTDSEVDAVDKSYRALALAKRNAKKNRVSIDFKRCDILKPCNFSKKYSILVSNPPYVKIDEEVTENTRYEPKMALYPGADDIIFYKRILELSKNIMTEKNIIAFEIGSTQAPRITDYIKSIYPLSKVITEKDYAGYDRFIFIFNNCE